MYSEIQTVWFFYRVMCPKDANSGDPDQTNPDLGLICLLRPGCPKTWDHYRNVSPLGDVLKGVKYCGRMPLNVTIMKLGSKYNLLNTASKLLK